MGFVRRTALRVAITVGAGYAAYRLLLDDAARENVRLATNQVRRLTEDLVSRAAEMGTQVGEDGPSERVSGKDAVYAQWESLGY